MTLVEILASGRVKIFLLLIIASPTVLKAVTVLRG